MGIGQVNHLIEIKRNDRGLIISDTVEHYPPIAPIEGRVQISLIEVILVQPSPLAYPENIPLSDLTLNPYFSYCIFDLRVSTATPIAIILLASSHPMTLLIDKIPQRKERHLS